MKTSTVVASLASAAAVSAQRPSDMSICDYYTTALLKENNATNQQTLLTLVVNTAVIGNYTQPNVGIKVPGILAPGTYNGYPVNLAPYFNGALASSNRGGDSGVSVNFLDGGAAAPLMKNMPAMDDSSNQYALLTHLYQYFAGLLGCSEYSNTTGKYQGDTSQTDVHRFMALNSSDVGYFIEQVGMSAASFGVTDDDVKAVGMALNNAFGYRCAPAAAIPATATPALQAICLTSDCPTSPNATCAAYPPVMMPTLVSTSPAMPSTTGNTTVPTGPMPSGSTTPTVTPSNAGNSNMIPILSSISVGILGAVVYFL